MQGELGGRPDGHRSRGRSALVRAVSTERKPVLAFAGLRSGCRFDVLGRDVGGEQLPVEPAGVAVEVRDRAAERGQLEISDKKGR